LKNQHLIIIDRGRIVAEGSVEELKKLYAPPSVLVIKLSKEYVEKASSILKRHWSTVYVADDEMHLHSEDPDEDMPKTVFILSENRVRVLSVSVHKPTLEDVFLKLTGRRLGE
jgi:ABC-2 type transport system ATP-binding protein